MSLARDRRPLYRKPEPVTIAPAPRPGVLDIAPYVGGEATIAGVERPIRLASNESALGPSAKAVAAYRALAGEIHRYPDGNAEELREALGRRHGLDPARIVCGAGSDELIALLLRSYAGPGDEVLYSRHGFLMYPIGAQTVGATPVAAPERELTTDVDALLERVTHRTRLVFIANPNNPTGTYLGSGEMARLHAELPPSVVLAIDAAYAEFVNRNDYEAGVAFVDRADNVVMLRTFSKIYALAGLRLGWAYCPPAIADVLNRMRGPFNVTAPALAAGVAAVEDVGAIERARAHNERWLGWFSERLTALGIPLTPSVGNFVLARFPDSPSKNADAAFAFLQSRGILVRQMGGYGLPQYLRITIGTGAEMERVADTLAEFMAAR
jgi:histidinol-phosphate aminotransferase